MAENLNPFAVLLVWARCRVQYGLTADIFTGVKN
jgi:hypothetical protein